MKRLTFIRSSLFSLFGVVVAASISPQIAASVRERERECVSDFCAYAGITSLVRVLKIARAIF